MRVAGFVHRVLTKVWAGPLSGSKPRVRPPPPLVVAREGAGSQEVVRVWGGSLLATPLTDTSKKVRAPPSSLRSATYLLTHFLNWPSATSSGVDGNLSPSLKESKALLCRHQHHGVRLGNDAGGGGLVVGDGAGESVVWSLCVSGKATKVAASQVSGSKLLAVQRGWVCGKKYLRRSTT